MKLILTDLYAHEFFENGGVLTLKDGTQILKLRDYTYLSDKEIDEAIGRIGQNYYIHEKNDDMFKYVDMGKFLSPRDAYGIKNVNFSLIKPDDERWEEYKKQREERGFDASELWSLDMTVARFIIPRLEAFIDDTEGYPPDMSPDEWYKILHDMLSAFQLLADDNLPFGKEEADKREETIRKGLDLFVEYFQHLWW